MHLNSDTFHHSEIQTLIKGLGGNIDQGLTSTKAADQLAKHGLNNIEEADKTNVWMLLLRQFTNPMVYVLVIAAGISFFFNEILDGSAILLVIMINSIIGFVMEFQANKSMEALKQLTIIPAKVIREGRLMEISSEKVVPGDLIFVEAGDMISADARIISQAQLEVNESVLTGESLPVHKQPGVLPVKTPLAERTNMLSKGTFVTHGNGNALVVATGMQAEIGKIAEMVQQATQSATPLDKKLNKLTHRLIYVTILLVLLIFVFGLLNEQSPLLMFETAIALAVAAIPEGLPIVATLALARGMLRLAHHQVIVKKLPTVETLGGTNVICTDKTGTLTQNRIEVSELHYPGDQGENSANYLLLIKIAALCNTASFRREKGKESGVGDPIEIGLLKWVNSAGHKAEKIRSDHEKIREMAFNSETKVMATMHRVSEGFFVAAKGAAEELMKECTYIAEGDSLTKFTPAKHKKWLQESENLALRGARVLAFAHKTFQDEKEPLLKDLTFAGLIAFLDPPAEGVSEAIAQCQSAGIKVVMITGDHPATAATIAQKIGIQSGGDISVMHGNEMSRVDALSEEEKNRWLHTDIFARVNPEQKLDLVTFLQQKKLVVGMTGDGVNDAPALKKADIGIAMGKRGTQVAQSAADMILKDDSFSSIVEAIRQGRIIFDNIRKFVIYLLSGNIAELMIIGVAAIMNLHFMLLPLQILFINLISDVLPALALGMSKGANGIMTRKPFKINEPIMGKKEWRLTLMYAAVLSACVIGADVISHELLNYPIVDEKCNNIVFYSLLAAQLFHVFNMNATGNILLNEVTTNLHVWFSIATCLIIIVLGAQIMPVAAALNLHPINWLDFQLITGTGLVSFLLIQVLKRVYEVLVKK